MAIMQRTRGLFSQIVSDVRKTVFWVNIIVQTIFFVFYGFSIYESIKNIPFLIIYSALLLISLIAYITNLVVYIKKLQKPKNFNRALRVFKYLANGTMLILNIVNMVRYGLADLNIILLAVSGISYIVQIILEFVRIYVEKYSDLIMLAIEQDLGVLKRIGEIADVKGNFLTMVNKPLEKVAGLFEKENAEENKKQKYINAKSKAYRDKLKAEGRERNAEKIRTAKSNISKNWKVIKEHLFKKKNKTNEEK